MGLKNKIQGAQSSVKDQMELLKKDSQYFKKIVRSKKIVHFKTDTIAILIRRKGNEEDFFKEFDNITREGYQMMYQEEITDPIPGIKVSIGYIYYFQHKKYIN